VEQVARIQEALRRRKMWDQEEEGRTGERVSGGRGETAGLPVFGPSRPFTRSPLHPFIPEEAAGEPWPAALQEAHDTIKEVLKEREKGELVGELE